MACPVTSDAIVIGGGVGGLSAAAALAPHLDIVVLEAEDHTGFHSSGRSATMFHFALGNTLIRALTSSSRALFDDPPAEFTTPAHAVPILVFARAAELDALREARKAMEPFTNLEWVEGAALHALCPLLRQEGPEASVAGLLDDTTLRIDQHALMQGYIRQLRANGGRLATGQGVVAMARSPRGGWTVKCASGESYSAPLVVNASGAWGDQVARLAGVMPLGLEPLRRTIITFDAPPGIDPARLPFCKTVGDELYFSGESGRLFASPMDEGESAPCDSQPDDLDVATAAWRMEQRTIVKVEKVHSKWSGLRTFAPDRSPVIGFAPDAEGFLWCVGQGGSGLQTSPACGAVVASLVAGAPWPIEGHGPAELGPGRLFGQAA